MGFFANLVKKSGKNLFFKACKYGDDNQVVLMLRSNPDLASETNNDGMSGILLAAESGHGRVLSILLDKSTTLVNTLDPFEGRSPLFQATLSGNIANVRLLLDHKAEPNLCDAKGITPLHIAADHEYNDICRLLMLHGANKHTKDNFGSTPLELAERTGSSGLADIFKVQLSLF